MFKWLRSITIVMLVLSLIASIMAYDVASAKAVSRIENQLLNQAKNFMNAAAGLKVDKAVSYWIADESGNVSSAIRGVPSGTKVSLAKAKYVVASQTVDTAEVNATYNITIKVKGHATISKNNENATFTLNLIDQKWLIAGSDVWNKVPWDKHAVAKEFARQELDNYIRLGNFGKLVLQGKEISKYLDQVAEVLNRIDSDSEELSAFKELLEEILGFPIQIEAMSLSSNVQIPVRDPMPVSYAPTVSPTPKSDRFSGSVAWAMIKTFVEWVAYSLTPGGTILHATDPEIARAMLKTTTRTQVYNDMFTNTADT